MNGYSSSHSRRWANPSNLAVTLSRVSHWNCTHRHEGKSKLRKLTAGSTLCSTSQRWQCLMGVAASAVCMDKIMLKHVARSVGIPVVPGVALLEGDIEDELER